MSEIHKLFAIRVNNRTRSCVLLRKFHDKNVWTFPLIQIPDEDDPLLHMSKLVSQLNGSFTLKAAAGIFDMLHEREDSKTIRNVIYDFRYRGKIVPDIPDGCRRKYSDSRWVQTELLKTGKYTLNFLTEAFVRAMEKEQCLR